MKTGVNLSEMVARRTAALICSAVGVRSSRYISAISSSTSARVSMSIFRRSIAKDMTSAGIWSVSVTVSPLRPSLYIAFILIKSTTPLKVSSRPIGTCTAAAVSLSLWLI